MRTDVSFVLTEPTEPVAHSIRPADATSSSAGIVSFDAHLLTQLTRSTPGSAPKVQISPALPHAARYRDETTDDGKRPVPKPTERDNANRTRTADGNTAERPAAPRMRSRDAGLRDRQPGSPERERNNEMAAVPAAAAAPAAPAPAPESDQTSMPVAGIPDGAPTDAAAATAGVPAVDSGADEGSSTGGVAGSVAGALAIGSGAGGMLATATAQGAVTISQAGTLPGPLAATGSEGGANDVATNRTPQSPEPADSAPMSPLTSAAGAVVATPSMRAVASDAPAAVNFATVTPPGDAAASDATPPTAEIGLLQQTPDLPAVPEDGATFAPVAGAAAATRALAPPTMAANGLAPAKIAGDDTLMPAAGDKSPAVGTTNPLSAAAAAAAAPAETERGPGDNGGGTTGGDAGNNGEPHLASAATTTAAAASGPAKADKPSAPSQPVSEQVAVQIVRAARDGVSRFHVTLEPDSLGRLDISLEIHRDGRVAAVITAANPQTLELLRQEAKVLEQSLNAAGLKADQDSFGFRASGDGPGSNGQGQSTPAPAVTHGRGSTDFNDTGETLPRPPERGFSAATGRLDIRA